MSTLEHRLKIFNKALGDGERSLEILYTRSGLGKKTFRKLLDQERIILPDDIIPWRTRPKIDALIQEGVSYPKIAKSVDLKRERVRDYIRESGQQQIYKSKREEQRYKQERLDEARGAVLEVLKKHVLKQAEDKKFPYEKAVRWYLSHNTSYSLDDVITVLQRYESAQKQREKISLAKLGKGLFATSTVGALIKKLGLEPMYGKLKRNALTRETKDAIERVARVNFCANDVAYFLNVKDYVVRRRWKKLGRKKGAASKVSYALASQIYEAHDLGFTVSESAELLDTSPAFVTYTQDQRDTIERKIMSALKLMHPTREIRKPYLS